jgi:hypothetical protein
VKFRSAHAEEVFTVNVTAPLAASQKTLSPATGKLAPAAPPDAADQLAVSFQLPVATR